ncbi:chemotaxis protein CheW [Motiliproteus sediminis]|uniref:chemotaxis protein CheW n=1 Tax=Motiliproteus sediminis TaxID=1468178 RepID=UPI001AEFA0EE|nr:chemotaxis protein CheW [Motiliproteus sediminis]
MGELASSRALSVEPSQGECGQYLTFYLQDEMFGLNITPIREISEYGKVTPVPMVPNYVRGVVNLRGNVVPVIDLPARFGWPSSPLNKRSCIVIVELSTADRGAIELGIVIDSVSEVLDIPAENIGSAPSFGAKVRTDFISGMGKVGDDFIVLLNAEKVLSLDELSQLEQVAKTAP